MVIFRRITHNFTLSKILVALFIVIPFIALIKIKLYGGIHIPCDYNAYLIIGSLGWILNNLFTPIVSEYLGTYDINLYQFLFGNKITLGPVNTESINTWKPNVLHMNVDNDKEKTGETNLNDGKRKRSESPIEGDKRKRIQSPVNSDGFNPESPLSAKNEYEAQSPLSDKKDYNPESPGRSNQANESSSYRDGYFSDWPPNPATKLEANDDPEKEIWELSHLMQDGTRRSEIVTMAEINWRLFTKVHVPGFHKPHFSYGHFPAASQWRYLTEAQKIRAGEELGYVPFSYEKKFKDHLEGKKPPNYYVNSKDRDDYDNCPWWFELTNRQKAILRSNYNTPYDKVKWRDPEWWNNNNINK